MEKQKKILLCAINAKYIHSNPAVYSLRAYAMQEERNSILLCDREQSEEKELQCDREQNKEIELLSDREQNQKASFPEIEIAEYTINNRAEEILADIYRKQPDVIAFSCYIWNWQMVEGLLEELPKVLPEVKIWLGGPEVSFYPDKLLEQYQMVTGIMVGEGEETFYELAKYYGGYPIALEDIRGLVYREQTIIHTAERELTDISKLPFLYDDLGAFENKIIYYESSRGCPYRCSYCLSSIDKKVRLRDIEIVKKELQFFLDNNVKQVKFVDRTFNCNHEHAKAIWQYLSEHDNGVTNFHFEIEADILSDEELEILSKMRPGLAQMEIGVQTVNPVTLKEIRRTTSIEKLQEIVKRIHAGHNIHVHLDLIAGLPFEDYESFIHSFNVVYAMQPEQLQLGFLKVLKGAYMYEKAADYEMQYLDAPPYEVLSTKWLSYDKILLLKQVEEMVELYYNSNQFTHTLPILQTIFPDAYSMYSSLAAFYEKEGYFIESPARSYRYQVLLKFAMSTKLKEKEELFRQALVFDLYLRENSKSRPEFAKDFTADSEWKQVIRNFYEKEAEDYRYLSEYQGFDSRQMSKMTHMEVFDYPVWEKDVRKAMQKLEKQALVLFSYRNRDALTYEAKTMRIV